MHRGSELVETWVPDGGFKIERRKVKIPDGRSAITDCLLPKWDGDELTRERPCARHPCLHRLFADCPLTHEGIQQFASRYGLLTVSIPRTPEPGQVVRASALPPEPIDIWRREIRALGACVELWETIRTENESVLRRLVQGRDGLDLDRQAREILGRRLSENLARVPFHLSASPGDQPAPFFKLQYWPVTLRAALWQRFAGEVAGLLQCARCPAPNCGRWFPRGPNARSDKQFCSNACKNRVFRRNQKPSVTSS